DARFKKGDAPPGKAAADRIDHPQVGPLFGGGAIVYGVGEGVDAALPAAAGPGPAGDLLVAPPDPGRREDKDGHVDPAPFADEPAKEGGLLVIGAVARGPTADQDAQESFGLLRHGSLLLRVSVPS